MPYMTAYSSLERIGFTVWRKSSRSLIILKGHIYLTLNTNLQSLSVKCCISTS